MCSTNQHAFLVVDANSTQEDPRIDSITASKALARCSIFVVMTAQARNQDVEMTDWNGEVDNDLQGSKNTGIVAHTKGPHIELFAARENNSSRYGRGQSNQKEVLQEDVNETGWQRRERIALKSAYAQAFKWWPNKKASKHQCESFLQNHSV